MGKTCKAELARQDEMEIALRIGGVNGSLGRILEVHGNMEVAEKNKLRSVDVASGFFAFFSKFQPVRVKCSSKM